jgi:hypothetical protein
VEEEEEKEEEVQEEVEEEEVEEICTLQTCIRGTPHIVHTCARQSVRSLSSAAIVPSAARLLQLVEQACSHSCASSAIKNPLVLPARPAPLCSADQPVPHPVAR